MKSRMRMGYGLVPYVDIVVLGILLDPRGALGI